MSRIIRFFIYAYRYSLSYFLGGECRFTPTCSVYAVEALSTHGIGGISLTVKRLCRCHPWGKHGFDPVPPRVKQTTAEPFPD